MPFITEKFPTYNDFAHASLEDIYTKDELEQALHHEAREFHSMIFINNNGQYEPTLLPAIAQVSPINGIVARDFTGDGAVDLLLAGNMFGAEVETPRYDAGIGRLLVNNGSGEFQALSPIESGFYVPGDVKDLQLVQGSDANSSWIIATNNNGPLSVFRVGTPEAATQYSSLK